MATEGHTKLNLHPSRLLSRWPGQAKPTAGLHAAARVQGPQKSWLSAQRCLRLQERGCVQVVI